MIDNIKTIDENQEQTIFLPPPALTPETLTKLKALAEKYGQKIYPPDYLG